MLRALSAALTNPATTVHQLELAIEFIKIDITFPWILRRFEALRVEESTLSLTQNAKRGRVADHSAAVVYASEEPVAKAARKRKPKSGAPRPVALAAPRPPVSRTVVAVTQPTGPVNVRARLAGICKSNCTIEGCGRVPCRFEHVKGVRVLTAVEKTRMKAMIALHNLNVPTTGFPTMMEDPAVVD